MALAIFASHESATLYAHALNKTGTGWHIPVINGSENVVSGWAILNKDTKQLMTLQEINDLVSYDDVDLLRMQRRLGVRFGAKFNPTLKRSDFDDH